jgi:hypothetical protein
MTLQLFVKAFSFHNPKKKNDLSNDNKLNSHNPKEIGRRAESLPAAPPCDIAHTLTG